MLKANRTYLLLLLIFTFSFIYRMLLMLWDTFPSGADIGLHNSVIYSITGSGNANFFYNFYQMGGGISLTFPGYHIFTSSIMLMTGSARVCGACSHCLFVFIANCFSCFFDN